MKLNLGLDIGYIEHMTMFVATHADSLKHNYKENHSSTSFSA